MPFTQTHINLKYIELENILRYDKVKCEHKQGCYAT